MCSRVTCPICKKATWSGCGQHKDMVAPLRDLFGIRVDYDLNLMRENQTLEHITVTVLQAALPWLMILLLFLVMVTYIPQISLFLPELVFD